MRATMRGAIFLAVVFVAACGDSNTTIINNETTGTTSSSSTTTGGGEGGAGGATSSNATGGGEGGATASSSSGGGGQGGTGGAACFDMCEDIPGACAVISAGVCGAPLDCTDACGEDADGDPSPWMECGPAGICVCNDANSAPAAKAICTNDPAAIAHCGGAACDARYCGDAPLEDVPSECLPSGTVPGGQHVYCCTP
jgi:hypothetical protein